MNKQELIQKIKNEVVYYARPRNLASMNMTQLNYTYSEAKRLNLLNKKPILVQIGQSFYSLRKEFEIKSTKELKDLLDSEKYDLRLLKKEV